MNSSSNIQWQREQLLWCTRGRTWGFRCLCRPTLVGVDWLKVRDRLFANSLEPEVYVQGKFKTPAGIEKQIIGARYWDPEPNLRDQSGRRISHEIALFLDEGIFPSHLPDGWHLQVHQALAPSYAAMHELETVQQDHVSFVGGQLEVSSKVPHSDWESIGSVQFPIPVPPLPWRALLVGAAVTLLLLWLIVPKKHNLDHSRSSSGPQDSGNSTPIIGESTVTVLDLARELSSPEMRDVSIIRRRFPELSEAEIKWALAYYDAHKASIDSAILRSRTQQ